MIETFANALKAFRRNAHVHQKAWRAVVICDDTTVLNTAWVEAVNILNGTSLAPQMNAQVLRRVIDFENGAELRFAAANTLNEVDLRLTGLDITHVIFVNLDDEPDLLTYAHRYLKSGVVHPEDYKVHVTKL